MSLATTLFENTAYLRGRRDMLMAIKKAKSQIHSVKKSQSQLMDKISREIERLRGRPLFYPALFSGLGNGPLAELVDGSIKYDFITGVGTHYFGHSDLDLISVALRAASQDVVMQGNLQIGLEQRDFLQNLLKMAGTRLAHGWLALSGSFANDNALKIIRQKKAPAYKVIAFKNCFHGRTMMMAEITDNEDYRKGLHRYGDVFYVPFFDPHEQNSVQASETQLKQILSRHGKEIACFVFELVQGEGGFHSAPRAFFARLMDICREAGIAIWMDEVQTVGRTGELFAFQKLDLETYADVVTVGKMLQNCATLYTNEFNPQPGLLAGTFCGSSVSLAVGSRILERLKNEKFFGKGGKIARLEQWAVDGLKALQKKAGDDVISNMNVVGAMVSWQYRGGGLEETKRFILKAFEEGVMLFYCGRGPYKIRFLLPAGALQESDYVKALKILERTIRKIGTVK